MKKNKNENHDKSEFDKLRIKLCKKGFFVSEPLKIFALKNIDFLNIKNEENGYSFGADQTWFHEEGKRENKFSKEYGMYAGGCGLSAFANLVIYLTRKEQLSNKIFDKYSKEGILNKEDYKLFAQTLNSQYNLIYHFIGYSIVNRFNAFANDLNLNLSAEWTDKCILQRIKEMLINDIPPIICIGNNLYPFKKLRLHLYTKDIINGHIVYRQAIKRKRPEPQATHCHFLTIVKLLEYEDNIVLIEVSSWGKKYYVMYEEYLNYVNKQPFIFRFMNNLIYIQSK